MWSMIETRSQIDHIDHIKKLTTFNIILFDISPKGVDIQGSGGDEGVHA
jgi:hypothetical protein